MEKHLEVKQAYQDNGSIDFESVEFGGREIQYFPDSDFIAIKINESQSVFITKDKVKLSNLDAIVGESECGFDIWEK
jgi:hypothetical protein